MTKSEEFSELLRCYGDMAYRMAWQITGGREPEARDLVQDGFVKAWRYWPLQRPGNFKGWMYRLLRNLYTDALRRRARRPTYSLDGNTESGSSWDETLALSTPSAQDSVERQELQANVARALQKLDMEFRLPVTLCDMEGLSYEEIARIMLCPVGTVRCGFTGDVRNCEHSSAIIKHKGSDPMTCQDYQNLLSAYLDRELKPDDQKEVSHHLEMCARCQGEVRQLLSVKETLRAQKLPSIPADLIADIEAQTLYQPGRWSSLNRWAGPVLALATAAAAWAFFEFHRPQVPGVPLTIQVTQAPKESMKLAQAVLASQPVSDSDTDKEDLQ